MNVRMMKAAALAAAVLVAPSASAQVSLDWGKILAAPGASAQVPNCECRLQLTPVPGGDEKCVTHCTCDDRVAGGSVNVRQYGDGSEVHGGVGEGWYVGEGSAVSFGTGFGIFGPGVENDNVVTLFDGGMLVYNGKVIARGRTLTAEGC